MEENQIASSASFEEKKFLSIVNIELNKQYRNQKVEIVFIYFQNDALISKDLHIKEFMKEFP